MMMLGDHQPALSIKSGRWFRYLTLTGSVTLSVSCGASGHQAKGLSALAAASGASTEAREHSAAATFREYFRAAARRHGYGDDEIRRQIFLPTEDLLRAPAPARLASSPADLGAALLDHARRFRPSEFYQNGQATPFATLGSEPELSLPYQASRRGPLTFVVLPGLMGEFIDDMPFSGIFAGASSFRNRYQDALDQVKDRVFDLGALGEVEVPLGDVVRLGGLDDPTGKPLLQVLFLRARPGSLESVGPMAAAAGTGLRRLSKALALMAPADVSDVYIVGYSRGLPVALEMAVEALAAPEVYPVGRALRGVVSLGGVTLGSEHADHGPLESVPSPAPVTGAVLPNWQEAWSAVAPTIRSLLAGGDPLRRLGSVWAMIDKVNRLAGVGTDDPALVLRRLGFLAANMAEASRDLKTAARLEWWQQHVLPASFTYVSLQGTMPEPSAVDPQSPLVESTNYGPDTTDFVVLMRPAADRIYDLTQVALNDSQVVESKQRLWPELMPRLNPAQRPLERHVSALLGTHHWGLGLNAAFRDAEGGGPNPYPREVLLEAVATYLMASQGGT